MGISDGSASNSLIDTLRLTHNTHNLHSYLVQNVRHRSKLCAACESVLRSTLKREFKCEFKCTFENPKSGFFFSASCAACACACDVRCRLQR